MPKAREGITRRFQDPDKGWTKLRNKWLRDEDLEWDDVGILTYLHSHRDGYVVKISDLVALRSAGRHRVEQSIERLEARGYLIRRVVHGANGARVGTEWILLDPA